MTISPFTRSSIVKWARWGVSHEPAIHYTEGPKRNTAYKPGTLPLYLDCSRFAAVCAQWAGLKQPWLATAFTGTFLKECEEISRGSVKPGDFIVYGPGTGDHMVVVVEVTPDYIYVVSHGREAGPERTSNEQQEHGQQPPTRFLRIRGL
jgi:hypothetical protein